MKRVIQFVLSGGADSHTKGITMAISKTVENWIGYGIAVAILVLFAWALCGCGSMSPDTSDVLASRNIKVALVNCTNCTVIVHQTVEGGAQPSFSLGYPDSNTVKVVADAYTTASGLGAAGTAVNGLGKGLTTVEAIKAAKP